MEKLCWFLVFAVTPLAASVIYSNGVPSSAGAIPSHFQSVRIYDSVGGGQSVAGTGTIFGANLNGNLLSFSIATAAHVIDSAPAKPVQIGFGSVDDSAAFTVTPDSTVTASGGGTASGSFPGADLGYVGVTIDLSSNASVAGNAARIALLETITPDVLDAAPANPGYSFNVFGYGISASTPSAADPASYEYVYHPDDAGDEYGIQRSFTNSISNYTTETLAGYTYNAGYYFLAKGAADGLGASLPGDSGAGVMVDGKVEGIVTFGPVGTAFCEGATCGYLGYNSGGQFGGVALTQPYVDWFQSESLKVAPAPEPGTVLLAGVGTSFLLLRARRSRASLKARKTRQEIL